MAEVVDIQDNQTTHAPIDGVLIVYEGQIVGCGSNDANAGDGLVPLAIAAGVADITNLSVPYGIVTGVNDVSQTGAAAAIDIGTGTPFITGVSTQAAQNARNWFGQEGMWSKGDPQVFAEVALIDSTTRIKIPIFNGAFGTAISPLGTLSSISATGLGFTSATAIDFTGVADYQTFYCRSGANAGLYRISETTSTTVHTFQHAWPHVITSTDVFVAAPVRFGMGRLQTDALSTYLDASATPGTAYFNVIYDYIDLREAGKEHAVFRFSPVHFVADRAVRA